MAPGQFLLLLSGCCGPPLHRARGLLLIALLGGLPVPALATPSLASDSPRATAGYYQLSWNGTSGPYELQESRREDFHPATTLYQGPDRATELTGRPDGDYYYRLRVLHEDGPGPWSEVLRIEVRHHPLSRALLFLAMGALVFLATLVAILAGNRRQRGGP